ncbi:hypothetical protein ACJ73_08255 [Blastomyces percursus]|uniref:Uncharacterized protein n=1 Tax=Blastomyces percursus TaxID=1658174 RepID=A0A1J9QJP7_9EURO|nr:hypothetical protein ACJ73_08255 [Blastomyces percursus]
MQIDYAIMGGAACCLTATDPGRMTGDVDLVIQVDQRMITADRLTTELVTKYPSKFAPVNQFGHTIPGYKLALPGGGSRVVDLEVFDFQSWPQRPQYNIQTASRRTMNINGCPVKIFSPEWILREKILSQYERQGGAKEATDIQDLMRIIPLAVPGKPELNFSNDQKLESALSNLLQKRPGLALRLKEKINCAPVFGNW